MNTVFSLGGDMMQPDIPNSFLKLLSEGEKPTRSNDSTVIFLLTDIMLIDWNFNCERWMMNFSLNTQALTVWRKTGSWGCLLWIRTFLCCGESLANCHSASSKSSAGWVMLSRCGSLIDFYYYYNYYYYILLCNKREKQKNSTCSYCSVYVKQLNIKVLEIQNSFKLMFRKMEEK